MDIRKSFDTFVKETALSAQGKAAFLADLRAMLKGS